jgi:single-stranded-DNA-specific exonuclease
MDEGYGLSQPALERLLGQGPLDLLVTLDSGTNAHQEIQYLDDQGIQVLIVDHHKAKGPLPAHRKAILVNPHVYDEDQAPWKHLCTVGLVFKLAHGLIKRLRKDQHPRAIDIQLKTYLDLVAMGTVADLMPLLKENRTLVRHGLKQLSKTGRKGLQALFGVCGLSLNQPIRPVDISFRIGPRINASGRIGDAALPLEMLLSEDTQSCTQCARQLDEINRERQDIERQITQEAQHIVESSFLEAPGIVLHNPQWHSGVVGVVAGKLARQYQKPCLILGKEGLLAKGSGRSVPGVNLVEVLGQCSQFLDSWGGHPMAIGIALKTEHLDAFIQAFFAMLSRADHSPTQLALPTIAAWIKASDITASLLEELELLHPFGEANPEPLFGIRSWTLQNEPELFGENNYRFTLSGQASHPLYAVAWKKADNLPPVGVPLDLALKVQWNIWHGRKYIQAELIDWRPSTKSEHK